MERFYEFAEKLGHNVEQLRLGEEFRSTVTVHNVEELRDLLHDDLPAAARTEKAAHIRQRLGTLMGPETRGTASGLTRRVEAYVFADEPLSEADRTLAQNAFPLTLDTASLPDKTIPAGIVWDLGTSAPTQVINLGTLTMEPGSSIVVHNTALVLSVDTLVRNGNGGSGPNYDIGIFGSTGPTGPVGTAGGSGQAGKGGTGGTCTVSGSEPGDDGGPGGRGGIGVTGGYGGQGRNGLPALTASIKIASGITGSAARLTIMTRSGTGGRGGGGGQGGPGGTGGNGGNGANCECTGTSGGRGGNGGTGGRGGTGGTGGNGTAGNDVHVAVPPGYVESIIRLTETVPPGDGGTGGTGGGGGPRGSGGSAGKHKNGGSDGVTGPPGPQGPPGRKGVQSGSPGQIYVTPSS